MSRGSICKSTQGFPQVCTGHFLHKGTWLRGVGAEIPPCSTLQPRPLLPPQGRPAFSTCIWAKGGPEILFFDPYPPRDPKVQYSSPHLQHYGCFFEGRGYAHGKGELILKIRFLFSEGGRKKERK